MVQKKSENEILVSKNFGDQEFLIKKSKKALENNFCEEKKFLKKFACMQKNHQKIVVKKLLVKTNEGIITASILHKYSTRKKITINGYKSNIIMGVIA